MDAWSFAHANVFYKKGHNVDINGHNQKKWSVHAEEMATCGIPKCILSQCTIYVVRITKNGELAFSKPCDKRCALVLCRIGAKKIFYSA